MSTKKGEELGAIPRGFSILRVGMRTAVSLLAGLVVLPVDVLFLLCDIFAINLKKLPLAENDCRGNFAESESGPCMPSWKYTNERMFRLVCADCTREDDAEKPRCAAELKVRHYLVRNLFGLLMIAGLGVGVIAGVLALGPTAEAPSRSTTAVHRLASLRLKTAQEAMSRGKYEKAAEFFWKSMKAGNESRESHYNLGLCLEKMGRTNRALRHFLKAAGATDAAGPFLPAVRKSARVLYLRGNFRPAGRYARLALSRGVESGILHAISADTSLREGDPEAARQRLHRAEQQGGPKSLNAVVKTRLLLQEGSLLAAEELIATVDPESAWSLPARLCRGELYWKQGRIEESLQELKALIREHPEVEGGRLFLVQTLLVAGRRGEAIDRVEAIQANVSLSPFARLSLANILNRHALPGHALDVALAVPDFSEVYLPANRLIAEIYLHTGLTVQAEKHVQRVLNEEPGHPRALLLAGQISLQRGRIDEAAVRFSRLPEGDELTALAHYYMGRAQLGLGNLEDALQNLERACDEDPEDGRFHYYYGVARERSGDSDTARKHWQKAAELLENPYRACTRLGWAAEKLGETDAAKRWYRRAIERAPERAAIASNNLANILLSEGSDPGLALELVCSARLNTSSPELRHQILDTLSRVLIQMGREKNALPFAREAARLLPGSTERQLRLAIAEMAAEHSERARAALRKTLELNPEDGVVRRARKLLESLDPPEKNHVRRGF